MKKIALLSVFDVNNYGSMLQTYAMQQVLTQLGCESEIINYKRKSLKSQFLRIFDKTLLKAKLNFLYRDFYGKYVDKELGAYFKNRDIVFDSFVLEYCKLSDVIHNRTELTKKMYDYDTVLVGSDQVWNPTNLKKDYYTMTFVPSEIKKVAYSSSFGVSSIPKNQKEVTAKYLSRIDYIGVRELSGKKIIGELTGRDVPVVADPTILLSNDSWAEIIDDKPLIEKDYIMCYFLGSNPKHRDFVRKLKIMTGFDIVTIPHCDGIVKADFGFGDIIPQSVGPKEFLNLMKNAKYVCTDSFHCCVFAMLNKIDFFVFSRFGHKANKSASTNSRIHSFLSITGLESRLMDDDAIPTLGLMQSVDYSLVTLELEKLRENSFDYLYTALDRKKKI